MKSIETERYILRIPRIEDAEEIYERWGTDKEKMAQYKAHKVYRNVIEAKMLITAAIKETDNGVTFWIIEEKNSNKIVGYIKLQDRSKKIENVKWHFTFWKIGEKMEHQKRC